MPPSGLLDPGPYRHGGHVVTFWQYVEPKREVDPVAAGEGLRAIHEALADYEGELPSLHTDDLAWITDSLEPSADVELVRELGLRQPAGRAQALHGDAHLANCLPGPLWHDFETACRGPRELDLAALALSARVRRRRRVPHRARGVRRSRCGPARGVPPGLCGLGLRLVHDRATTPAGAGAGAGGAAWLAPRDLRLRARRTREAGRGPSGGTGSVVSASGEEVVDENNVVRSGHHGASDALGTEQASGADDAARPLPGAVRRRDAHERRPGRLGRLERRSRLPS